MTMHLYGAEITVFHSLDNPKWMGLSCEQTIMNHSLHGKVMALALFPSKFWFKGSCDSQVSDSIHQAWGFCHQLPWAHVDSFGWPRETFKSNMINEWWCTQVASTQNLSFHQLASDIGGTCPGANGDIRHMITKYPHIIRKIVTLFCANDCCLKPEVPQPQQSLDLVGGNQPTSMISLYSKPH